MNTNINSMTILACVGIAAGIANAQDIFGFGATAGQVRQIAHIYYNAASGERVITVEGGAQTSGADTGSSSPLWVAQVGNMCGDAGAGFTTSYFFAVDNPGTSSLSTNIALLDHGDIALDTVVDCFQVNWIVAHADTDTNFDSIGDGVEGLAGEWTVWDADNGRIENQSTRMPLVSIEFINLPGNVAAPGFLSGYTANIDLSGGVSGSDLTFEIGDSDGDCQTAAFCNSNIANMDNDMDGLPDSDLDGDGLFDWSWTVRFTQPGSADLDGDGSIDGVPAPTDADTIGISFGAPEGMAVDNGGGDWDWIVDTSVEGAGFGAEDHAAIYAPFGPNGELVYAADFGGDFSCDGVPIGDGGMGYTPAAMFAFALYGPTVDPNPCHADLNNDGQLNFFDVSLFIQQYQAGGDYNGDGNTDFFDVSQYIQDYNAGCP